MHKQGLMHIMFIKVNPVIDARRALGMRRQDLVSQANLSLSTIEYLEKGCYGDIPPSVKAILEIYNPNIQADFDRWRVEARINQNVLPREIDDAYPELTDLMHPHQEWRQSINNIGINLYCDTIKIQRNVIQNLEHGRQLVYPKQLHIALTMACGIEVSERIRLASIAYAEDNATTNPGPVQVH